MKKPSLIFIIATLLVSCVSKKKYLALETEKTELNKEVNNLQQKVTGLAKQNTTLLKQGEELKSKNASLNRQIDNYKIKNDETIEKPQLDVIYTVVEKHAQFPGGTEKLYKYLTSHIKYPVEATKAEIQGKVYAQFVVEKDGSLSGINIARGLGHGCDKETIRVIKAMPNWNPGEQRGKKVRMRYTLPVQFTIR